MAKSITHSSSNRVKPDSVRNKVWLVSLVAAIYYYFFSGYDFYNATSFVLTIFVFLQFVSDFGYRLPLKGIITFLMVQQMLFAPAVEYAIIYPWIGFSNMWVEQDIYYSYALPAIILFVLGLYLPVWKTPEVGYSLLMRIRENKARNIRIGFGLLAIGVFSYLIMEFLEIKLLNFLFLIFALFRFIGVLYIWYAGSKWRIPLTVLVFGHFFYEVLSTGLFIDMIVWGFFLYAFLAIEWKIPLKFTFVFVFLASGSLIVLQSVKTAYRTATWVEEENEEKSNISTLKDLFSQQLRNMDRNEFGISLYVMNKRINQGMLLSQAMRHVPKKEPFTKGKTLLSETIGILAPRFLYHNKPVVGDKKKFEQFTGFRLNEKTTMNIGVLGDGYVNFGKIGGSIFCLAFGLFLNFFIAKFLIISLRQPTLLLWMPLLFFVTMRAGNDYYMIVNWMVKCGFVVWLFYYFTSIQKIRLANSYTTPQSA